MTKIHMMKVWFTGVLLLLSISCNEQSRFNPVLGYSPYADQVAKREGDEFRISVKSNLEWVVTVNDLGNGTDWCRVDKPTGAGTDTVVITVAPNPENGGRREVEVLFAAGEEVAPSGFTIRQKQWVDQDLDIFTIIEDPEFLAYCQEQKFDRNEDGKLSVEEVEAVTGINVNGRNIASLKGIEYFFELTSLQCARTAITQLDVRNLGELKTLDYNETPVLDSVDVSLCPNLETLYCYGSAVTKLDLRKNTLLRHLRCQNTALQAIDVTYCPELRELWCANTQVQVLNLTLNEFMTRLEANPNPSLTVIYVWDEFSMGSPPVNFRIPVNAHYDRLNR